jgi:peroxiredoxin
VRELSSSRDDLAKFEAEEAQILAISMNVRFSQKAFADFLKLNFPLLSDYPDANVTRAYGVYNEKNRLAHRSWFVIDKQGIVRFKHVSPDARQLLPNETLLEELKKIGKKS